MRSTIIAIWILAFSLQSFAGPEDIQMRDFMPHTVGLHNQSLGEVMTDPRLEKLRLQMLQNCLDDPEKWESFCDQSQEEITNSVFKEISRILSIPPRKRMIEMDFNPGQIGVRGDASEFILPENGFRDLTQSAESAPVLPKFQKRTTN